MYTISKVGSSLSRFRTSKDLQSCPLTSRHCKIFGLPLPCRPSSWVACESTSHVYVRDTYTSTACVVYWLCTDFWGSKWKQVYQATSRYCCLCLSVVGECVSIVYQRLSFFFHRETTGLLLVLLLGIYPRHSPVRVLNFYCATCMHSAHSELVDERMIGNHLITYISKWKILI